MPLYTRRGDRGQTDLGNGARLSKGAARISAYGELDELSAALGLARAWGAEQHLAVRVQRQLLSVGAILANPAADASLLAPLPAWIAELEREIDLASEKFPPLRDFILPGASAAEAALHLARTICRRAERTLVRLSETEDIPPAVLQYLNRLSDWLFAQARATTAEPR